MIWKLVALLFSMISSTLDTNATEILLVSIHQYEFIEEQPCTVCRIDTGKNGARQL